MKKNYLSFICIFIILSVCSQAHAQKNHIEKMILKEKKVLNDTTELVFKDQKYIYDKADQIIRNTKIIMPKKLGKQSKKTEHCRIENYKQLDNVYKKIFSKERMIELKNSMIFISCMLDISGSVKGLDFFLMRAPDVTLEEIHALETALLNFNFKLINTAEEQQNYLFPLQCCFHELAGLPRPLPARKKIRLTDIMKE